MFCAPKDIRYLFADHVGNVAKLVENSTVIVFPTRLAGSICPMFVPVAYWMYSPFPVILMPDGVIGLAVETLSKLVPPEL